MPNVHRKTTNRTSGPILVTGGAGMIGSLIARHLNETCGHDDLIIVDRLRHPNQRKNLGRRRYADYLDQDHLLRWLESGARPLGAIIHMGAITDTTERDFNLLARNNLEYSQLLWQWCVRNEVPFLYASSAATYGAGEHGYDDNVFDVLRPLNAYAHSKHLFDRWVLRQVAARNTPPQWCGFKFFNVYGPNEYHKGHMASMAWHSYTQCIATRRIRLFRSANPAYADGMQLRDFVYVKDAVAVVAFFLANPDKSGIYNVGTGRARSFKDLAAAVMHGLEQEAAIDWVDMPASLEGRYQYFTEARIDKLRAAGYRAPFHSLEDGVRDYVCNYLTQEDPYC